MSNAQTKRAIRFQPEPLDYALIDFTIDNLEFTPAAIGLILNESATGCALVLKAHVSLKQDLVIRIKVGSLATMHAKIIRIEKFDKSVCKVGIQFLE